MKKPSTASLRYFALLLGTVGLLWSVSVSVADDPRQWGPPGKPIRQGHHIEWQRAAYVDANGYTIMVWSDTRTGDRDVYAQLIEPDGDLAPGWPVHVVNHPYRQEDPEPIVTDGGFIITWIDFRFDSTGDVFAQKLNYSGVRQWDTLGVVVDTFVRESSSMVNETTLRGATDGAGGAIIAWEDNRLGDAGDIFARRINSSGQRMWTEALAVTNSSGIQSGITADTDGQGGLIVGWNDNRDVGNVYAAKITNTGTLPWGGEGGIPVCDFTDQQTGIKLCPDLTTGGAYFAWADKRNGNAFDIYTQRFNGAGVAQWAEDGIPMVQDTLEQSGVRITPSFSGGSQDGVLYCWQDFRVNGSVAEVYGQKFSPAGSPVWTPNGVRVCGDAGPNGTGATRDNSRLTSDLSGGALYVWDDTRDDAGNILQYDTYFQHVEANGDLGCAECGFAINTNDNQQQEAVLRTNGTNTYCIYSDFYRGSRTMRIAEINVGGCSVDRDQEYLFGLDGDATNPTNINMFWGNVAFVWEDNRGGNFGKQVYYQVLDTTNEKTFPHIPDNGSPIAPVSEVGTRFEQSEPVLCRDDNNGFFCAFASLTDGVIQIRLQRVGVNGQLLCDLAGEVVSATGVDQKHAQVVPDGSGGCYVVWSGYLSTQSFQLEVYVMRMNGNCEPMWAQPVRLTEALEYDDVLQSTVADGNGCVIAVWQTSDFGNLDIMGAKVCGDGTVAWQHPVSAAPREQSEANAAADGQGGVYVAWSDTRNEGSLKDVYGQRFNANGEAQWTNNGRLIVSFAQEQKIPRLAVDSQGLCYVVWQDSRSTRDIDLYGQKLNLDGSAIWTAEQNGRAFCQASSDQSDQQLLVDWQDGLYMVWEDGRTNPYSDLYGVHINSDAEFTESWWDVEIGDSLIAGGPVNTEYQNQNLPALAHDYHGGTVAVWVDWRSSGKEPLQNIWANWVNDYTVNVREVPAPMPREYTLTQNFPNPFNPTTEFRFTIPATEAVKISVYNMLGQEVENLIDEVMHAGTYNVRFDASALSSGTYFYRLETPSFQSVKKMVMIK